MLVRVCNPPPSRGIKKIRGVKPQDEVWTIQEIKKNFKNKKRNWGRNRGKEGESRKRKREIHKGVEVDCNKITTILEW